jgi:hypothetical protein
MSDLKAVVTWADGNQDIQRECSICKTQTCIKPTHGERYRVVVDKLAREWDKTNPVV